MTVQTDPQAPAWVDMNEVMPAELRADIANMTSEVTDFAPILDELMRRAHVVFTRADKAVTTASDAIDDTLGEVFDVLASLTGMTDLVQAISALQGPILAAYGDSRRGAEVPEWAKTKD